MAREPERVARLRANGSCSCRSRAQRGWTPASAQGYSVVSVIVGDSLDAGAAGADRCLRAASTCCRSFYPGVPDKAARLRFFITSEHTPTQIREAVRTMREEMDGLGKQTKAEAGRVMSRPVAGRLAGDRSNEQASLC